MGSGLGQSLAPPTGMSLMQRPSSSSDHHLSPSGHLTPTGIHIDRCSSLSPKKDKVNHQFTYYVQVLRRIRVTTAIQNTIRCHYIKDLESPKAGAHLKMRPINSASKQERIAAVLRISHSSQEMLLHLLREGRKDTKQTK